METLFNRYRNITVLLLVIFAQLVLLGYQVKGDRDVRILRVWAVTGVTPLARAIEGARSGTAGIFENYFVLRDLREENSRLKAELGKLKVENTFLRNELSTADRAKLLAAFQTRTPSKTLAARIFGTSAGGTDKVLFVDRGTLSGVQKGMAVLTPDGIVGKILGAFPTASQVELITDPDFAAGVISAKHQVRGTLKGRGFSKCKVDYVANEEKLEPGEIFYTSGDDRVFPRGFPAAIVREVRPGSPFKEIVVEPISLQHGIEEVLIVLEGVHQPIPEPQQAGNEVYLAPPPPAPAGAAPAQQGAPPPVRTEADRLHERYREVGEAQGHKFGEGGPGSRPPDFNLQVKPGTAPPAPAAAKPAPARPGPAPERE